MGVGAVDWWMDPSPCPSPRPNPDPLASSLWADDATDDGGNNGNDDDDDCLCIPANTSHTIWCKWQWKRGREGVVMMLTEGVMYEQ